MHFPSAGAEVVETKPVVSNVTGSLEVDAVMFPLVKISSLLTVNPFETVKPLALFKFKL